MGTGLSVHCCENVSLPERCRCDIRRLVCCGGDGEADDSGEESPARRSRKKKRRPPPDADQQLIMLKNPQLKLNSLVPRNLERCGYFIFDAIRSRFIAAEGNGPSSLGLDARQLINQKIKALPPRGQDIVSICQRTLQGGGEFMQIQLLYKSNVVLATTFPIANNLGNLLAVLLVTRPMPRNTGIDLDRFVVVAPRDEDAHGQAVPAAELPAGGAVPAGVEAPSASTHRVPSRGLAVSGNAAGRKKSLATLVETHV